MKVTKVLESVLASELPKSIKFNYIIDRDDTDTFITKQMVEKALLKHRDDPIAYESISNVVEIMEHDIDIIVLDDRRDLERTSRNGFYERMEREDK